MPVRAYPQSLDVSEYYMSGISYFTCTTKYLLVLQNCCEFLM